MSFFYRGYPDKKYVELRRPFLAIIFLFFVPLVALYGVAMGIQKICDFLQKHVEEIMIKPIGEDK